MKIALIGYGKMGRAIEEIALARGHEPILKIDLDNFPDFNRENISAADVAIEFSGPDSAFANVKKCLQFHIPVVSGSTGWLDRLEEARQYCVQQEGALLYSSNFSIGVNIFFELNRQLARLMAPFPVYEVSLTETHHTQKKDAPSGTAITLAEQLMEIIPTKKKWVNRMSHRPEEIGILSKREDPAPGTHQVAYRSAIDDIEILHTAHSRTGFATGAVLAAEFIVGKKGSFSMREVLGF